MVNIPIIIMVYLIKQMVIGGCLLLQVVLAVPRFNFMKNRYTKSQKSGNKNAANIAA